MVKYLMAFLAMLGSVGCGERKNSTDYPKVSGIYDAKVMVTDHCSCQDGETYSLGDNLKLIVSQTFEGEQETPTEYVDCLVDDGERSVSGTLGVNGSFFGRVSPSETLSMEYDGIFYTEGGVAWGHRGALTSYYNDGACCNGQNGYAIWTIEAVRELPQ